MREDRQIQLNACLSWDNDRPRLVGPPGAKVLKVRECVDEQGDSVLFRMDVVLLFRPKAFL